MPWGIEFHPGYGKELLPAAFGYERNPSQTSAFRRML
jgi:hypothetical protein